MLQFTFAVDFFIELILTLLSLISFFFIFVLMLAF